MISMLFNTDEISVEKSAFENGWGMKTIWCSWVATETTSARCATWQGNGIKITMKLQYPVFVLKFIQMNCVIRYPTTCIWFPDSHLSVPSIKAAHNVRWIYTEGIGRSLSQPLLQLYIISSTVPLYYAVNQLQSIGFDRKPPWNAVVIQSRKVDIHLAQAQLHSDRFIDVRDRDWRHAAFHLSAIN